MTTSPVEPITFTLEGIKPVPQGSKNRGKDSGVYDQAGRRLAAYRRALATLARQATPRLIPKHEPVSVTIAFYIKATKKHADKIGQPCMGTTRGDTDKLARSVCDALTGTTYHDDKQVTRLIAGTYYGHENATTVRVEKHENLN